MERFLDHTRVWLAQTPEESQMILGVCQAVMDRPDKFADPLFISLEDSAGRFQGVVVQTPPQRLIVSRLADEAANTLVDDLKREELELPGVYGPAESAQELANLWARETGAEVRMDMNQRMYSCRSVIPPVGCEGSMRQAVSDDVPLLVDWRRRFIEELGLDDPVEDLESVVRQRLEKDYLFVWETGGQVVSTVAIGRPTDRSVSVTFVYTPPELRGKGYASCCTAELTQMQMASGREFCVLFADLANPISNRIYEKIGYEIVTDFQLWTFA